VSKQPRPKKLKALRQRYSGVTYSASVHRQDEEGNWIVEKISCLCSDKAEKDVKHLLSEIDRLEELIAHLLKHHVPCEECIEYLTPVQ
jgi:hypothetical protein